MTSEVSPIVTGALVEETQPTEDLYDADQVGASSDRQTLRLWKATEAQRIAKDRIDAQMKLLERYMARGASFVGWGLTATIGLSAVWRLHSPPAYLWIPATLTAAASFSAALLLWPRRWQISGDLPSYLDSLQYETELELRETLAQRDEQGIKLNDIRLGWASVFMKLTLGLMAAAALSVAVIFLS